MGTCSSHPLTLPASARGASSHQEMMEFMKSMAESMEVLKNLRIADHVGKGLVVRGLLIGGLVMRGTIERSPSIKATSREVLT